MTSALPARALERPRDAFGRVIDYLRISVTDRCNLRCVYCMPLSKKDLPERPETLSAAEIEEVVRAATSVGFRKFRLTGGEPTLRADIVDVVRRVASVPGAEDVAMTTNAVRLVDLAKPLAEAGLRRVNVHLDTLSAATLPRVMRLGSKDAIWAAPSLTFRASCESCRCRSATPMSSADNTNRRDRRSARC